MVRSTRFLVLRHFGGLGAARTLGTSTGVRGCSPRGNDIIFHAGVKMLMAWLVYYLYRGNQHPYTKVPPSPFPSPTKRRPLPIPAAEWVCGISKLLALTWEQPPK